jgi:LysR family glycine cleavage system transcriptional activator
VELTGRGRDYLAELSDVLDRMEGATQHVRDNGLRGPLSVRATPAFASRWLLPRLGSFSNSYPGIELHISILLTPADFATENIDVAVQWGEESRAGLRADPFLETSSYPVASPGLLRGGPPLRRPDDLRHYTLLREEVDDAWPQWLARAGADNVDVAKGPRFEHCDLALQAAIEGQGIALAYAALAAADIASGRLVRLFAIELPPTTIYSIVTPEAWSRRPRIAAFRNWLIAEARKPGGDRTPPRGAGPTAKRKLSAAPLDA